jgi:hypothetical protein
MDDICEFYNEQIFKSVHKLTKLNCQMQGGEVDEGEAEIKNMFFLIGQGLNTAFRARDETTGELNHLQI